MFKQRPSPPPELEYGTEEEVMIEPLAGHTSQEILRLFVGSGAEAPMQLGPEFLSGKVPLSLRSALHQIAVVHRKATKKMHWANSPLSRHSPP